MTEAEAYILKAIYESAHDLFETVGEKMPDAEDIPEWVTFKLMRVAYHDSIIRILAKHGLELEGSAKNVRK